MIVYITGTYQISIHSYRPKDIKCHSCGASSQVIVEKKASVFHLMYIPIFPYRIKNIFTCKSCNNVFELKDLKPEHKSYYKNFVSKKWIPIWLFSGLIVILLGIGFFVYNNIKNKEERLNKLTDGNQKQIIEFKTDNGQYTTLRTVKITSDSIWLNYNNYEIETYDLIYRISGSGNYASDTLKVNINDIKELFEQGNVKSIYPY
ncbi:zinc-ribbon domain-containing protein [Winogradskyella echinorum]|uniref:Zinc-ribbon domain-containing protein n=1 Tax=Winogradskyella echinorum TaxID=538189 RepID=A0ABR6Y285_9FLAO|nr:zinc-ribbon domain-containing protein [Winogradskyella echinorum]MBC3846825.1 zinc-ribbon domain-containing protein [Winogradskyella echinorum]MBC5751173.1 zinc-ribbon domain-containing protein [Winogradskyella echinorum]